MLTSELEGLGFLRPVAPDWRAGGAGGVGTVRLAGELDLLTAPWTARALRRALAGDRIVVLDLRALRFMDVVGMHVVLHAAAIARQEDRRLIVVRGPAHVDAVFTLTGSDALLELVDLRALEPPEAAFRRGAPGDRDSARGASPSTGGSGSPLEPIPPIP